MRPVRRIRTEVRSVRLDALGQPVVRLRTPAGWGIRPGQAVLADLPGTSGLLTTIFPSEIDHGLLGLRIEAPLGFDLGSSLDLVGPVGTAFHPPASARRWLLLSSAAWPARLLPLIELGLRLRAELVLIAPGPIDELPESIEILPSLDPAVAWADYLAVDTTRDDLPSTLEALARAEVHAASLSAEVLIATEMLCGWGGCGACAVHGNKGWFLACVNGPVRPLAALVEGHARRRG